MDKQNVRDAVKEKAAKRAEKYETVGVEALPDPTALGGLTYIGTYSMTCTSSRKRFIKQSSAVRRLTFPELASPGETARDYLDVVFPRVLRYSSEQRNEYIADHAIPLLAIPGKYGEGKYLDLKSAYFQIINVIGWNTDYMPHQYLGIGRATTDFPFPNHRDARNGLVAACWESAVQVWTGREFDTRTPPNRHYNPSLWTAIQDILMEIGYRAMRHGAVYVNTDGYIFPHASNWERFAEALSQWGIRFGIKAEGDIEIIGVGAYRVGQYASGRVSDTPAFYSNIRAGWEGLLRTYQTVSRDRVDNPYLFGV